MGGCRRGAVLMRTRRPAAGIRGHVRILKVAALGSVSASSRFIQEVHLGPEVGFRLHAVDFVVVDSMWRWENYYNWLACHLGQAAELQVCARVRACSSGVTGASGTRGSSCALSCCRIGLTQQQEPKSKCLHLT